MLPLSAAGPESCWPELAGGSPPCRCAGHSCPCLPHAQLQSPETTAELGSSKRPGHGWPGVRWQGTTYVLGGFLETVLQSWSKYEEAEGASGLAAVSRWFRWRERAHAHVQQVAIRVGKRLQLLGYAGCCVGLQHCGIRLLGTGIICSS